jgi:hypothetical protein
MKKTFLSLTLFLALGFGAGRVNAQISVGISVRVAPPAIPVYTQPPCPVDGYLWVPGYWAWDDEEGYYWVPGYWAAPPTVGFLWTPGYWGWSGGVYAWHAGYWGPHVGFYGGVNYGCGYGGVGYVGGEWYGGHFRYNTAVTRVNTTVIHNTYINRTVIVNNNVRTSFNGGPNGVRATPTAQERVAMNEHHVAPTSMQTQHQQAAHQDRGSFANVNHGRPATAAVARPLAFNNHATANAGHVSAAAAPRNNEGNHSGAAPMNRPNNASPSHSQPQMHTRNQPRPQISRPAPQHYAAPAQHQAPQQHYAAPAQHQAPQQHYAAPAQHQAPPQHYAAPAQHQAPQQHYAPQQHSAPHGNPAPHEAPRGGGGGEHHHR